MKMIEEKQIIRKHSRLIWVFICIYFLIVAGFYLGKSVGERQGLEYRFWVDACFRIWVWFVPILFAGIMILRICIKQWKRKSPWRWILSVLLLVYGCGAVYVSFIYVLVNAFTITSDEKMPDGNLVVAEPYGMESIHHYAEPVAISSEGIFPLTRCGQQTVSLKSMGCLFKQYEKSMVSGSMLQRHIRRLK